MAPKKTRQATHDVGDVDQDASQSETSNMEDDSWYCSDDGKVSQAYLEFAAKHGSRPSRVYLPGDDKCDRFFRSNKRCDAILNGMPCLTCVHRKTKCAPQSKETKRLVLPENRTKSKPIAHPKLYRPCRLCFQTDRSCYLGPGDVQCERCKSENRKCNGNLEGAKKSNVQQKEKDAKKLATQERLGFTPVPRDQKSYRCAQRNISCDGRHPCVKCNTIQLRRSCRPQEEGELPPCNWCKRTVGTGCNRGRPCRTCIDRKNSCTYDAQNGLLKRTYQVPGGPLPQGFSTV